MAQESVDEHPSETSRPDALTATRTAEPEWPPAPYARAVGATVLVRYWFRPQNRAPMAGITQTEVDWKEVGLFLLIAFGISWGAWIGLRTVFPSLAVRTFLAMFGPTFAAVFTVRLRAGHHPRLHLRLTRRTVAWGSLAGVLAAIIVTILVEAGVRLSLLTGDLRSGAGSGQDLFQVLPLPIALAIYWVTAFGEEYGWRGFLLPVLSPLGGAPAAILVSVIFATWHLPAILVDGFNYPRHHLTGALVMYVFALPFSVVMCWLRSATRTVVAPTTGHAMFNILTGLIYAGTSRTTSVLAAPVGLLGSVPLAAFAALILLTGRLWRKVDAQPSSHL